MSEEFDLENLDREEQAILTAVDRVASGGADALDFVDGDPVDAQMVREHTEVLGLLPYELEPAFPNVGTKVRLLAAISGATGGESSAQAMLDDRTVAEMTFRNPVADREASEVTLRHGAARDSVDVTLAGRSAEQPMLLPVAKPASSGGSQWMTWALAAMLGFCLLGLGYLYGKLEEQQATIVELRTELLNVPDQMATLQEMEGRLTTLNRRHQMITQIATRAYPMRAVNTAAPGRGGRESDGIIYVCGQHQRWYLNVKGLAPPPSGMEYHLWFMTAEGPVNGGPIRVGEDSRAEMDALTMPAGTQGFTITLEKSGPHDEPEGTMVLLGEEAVSL